MARGFSVGADALTTTTDGRDLNDLWTEYQQLISIRNKDRTAVTNLFTYLTTLKSERLNTSAADERFEAASEFGVPTSFAVPPSTTPLGFPLNWYDRRNSMTFAFLRDAAQGQVDAVANTMLDIDSATIFRDIMQALTSNVARVNEEGTTVYPLYSADGFVPPTFAGNTFSGTHSHYLTSGAATVDGGDLKDLIVHLQHHGYGLPGDGSRIVILANPSEADVIAGFRIPSTGPTTALPYDFIPSAGAPAYLTDKDLVGDRAPAEFNGLAVQGSYGDAYVVKHYLIPQGYLIAVATGGGNSPRNPLAFREHVRPEMRGLKLVGGTSNPSYPLIDSIWARGFGVGVRNRGAAAVMQITASGTYTAPTFV